MNDSGDEKSSGEKLWTPGWVLAVAVMVLFGGAVVAVFLWERSMGTPSDLGGAGRSVAQAESGGGGPGIRAEIPGSGTRGRSSPEDTFDLADLQIPREQIRSGGPPKDGIPALTTAAAVPEGERDPGLHGPPPPRFLPAEEAVGELGAEARAVGVTIDGEARAYPVRILNWHEAVNDVVGGVPIAVIYCPLCDSVSVVDRRVEGQTYEFGISGLLYNSNVLLYDRTDQALWSQVKFQAVSGPNAGKPLKHVDGWRMTRLGDFAERHPNGTVLSKETGHRRNYDRNTYERYAATDRLMFPVENRDDRLAPKARVIGVRVGGVSRAYPLDAVHEAGTLRDRINGEAVVIESLGEGDSRSVRIAESPAGAQVLHTYWFAWAAMWPETELVRAADLSKKRTSESQRSKQH